MLRKRFVWGVILWTLACAATEIFGQTGLDESDPVWERLLAAEARIHELEAAHTAEEWDPGGFFWESGYDQGFFVRPMDSQENPFELRINGRVQARHTGFTRRITEWRDNSGAVQPVTNRNDFEIERGRLEFRGFFLDPNLQFFMNLDADTDDRNVVIMHDFWINYEFSEAFDLYVGKAFVPGSRDWLNGSLRTRFADRSMATTYFRPDRTVGVWARGEPVERVYYRIMAGNGFNTADLTPDEIDTRFVYSASLWMDFGDYGEGYSDLEWHGLPVSQIGQSFTFAGSGGRNEEGRPLAEENFVRLSDGTRLTQLGALAPGISVDHFDIYLYAVDAAVKYRGFSLNSEYYLRWLQSIRGNGPLPLNKLFDHGFKFEAGYFLLPQRLEVNSRVSQVFGPFGDGQEYAGGFNWFFDGSHNLKLTVDVTKLNQNPANNTGPNLRAGDDGVLVRTQLQAAF